MKIQFDFLKWAFNNCVNRGLNCLSYNGEIYDLDRDQDQKNLFIQYQKTFKN
jgi:hypothetical protein